MNDYVHVIDARAVGGFSLYLRFEDGVEGVIDLEPQLLGFKGVFAPLKDPQEFAKVRVEPEWGTVVWPSGADIVPETLSSLATGRSMETGDAAEGSPEYRSP